MSEIAVIKYRREEWKAVSADAHKICFNEIKHPSMDRIDFALLSVKDGVPTGFVTCREHDPDTLYWQFGGAFPGCKGTVICWRSYQAFVEKCRPHYKRITTIIENTNTPMLRMAMKVGFRIYGVRYFNGILVEHVLDLTEKATHEDTDEV